MRPRCDAVSPTWSPHAVYCKRKADWVATWGSGGGRVWYCRYHKASRQKDVALGDWRRLTKAQ